MKLLKLIQPLLFFLTLSLGAPLITEIKRDYTVDSQSAFKSASNAIWLTFWNTDKNAWDYNDPQCSDSTFTQPSVWISAVAGMAITETYDSSQAYLVAQSLIDNYLNSDNWFSSSTAKDDDVYTDDNAQAIWVLVQSYCISGTVEHLSIAEKVLANIQDQWDSNEGGIKWKINGDYLASISTAEAALAAVRIYQNNQDENLLTFAEKSIKFLFDKLQDSSDNLFYDGIDTSTGQVNKGKLTYTVGTAISTLAYLSKFTGNEDYTNQAIELAKAAINKDGAFYSTDGYWNNQLQYIHLLYAGLVDLLVVATPTSQSQDSFYQEIIAEMQRQAEFTYNYLQLDDTGFYFHNVYTYTKALYSKFASSSSFGGKSFKPNSKYFCDNNVSGTPKRSLMDSASAAQVFYELGRVT